MTICRQFFFTSFYGWSGKICVLFQMLIFMSLGVAFSWFFFWFYRLTALYYLAPLACIYMDLRNASFLITASGHHWGREMSRQKSEPLVNCICWLSPANQKAYHKHWIVFSAYRMGVALHRALHYAVSNDDFYIVCNAFWTAILFL